MIESLNSMIAGDVLVPGRLFVASVMLLAFGMVAATFAALDSRGARDWLRVAIKRDPLDATWKDSELEGVSLDTRTTLRFLTRVARLEKRGDAPPAVVRAELRLALAVLSTHELIAEPAVALVPDCEDVHGPTSCEATRTSGGDWCEPCKRHAISRRIGLETEPYDYVVDDPEREIIHDAALRAGVQRSDVVLEAPRMIS